MVSARRAEGVEGFETVGRQARRGPGAGHGPPVDASYHRHGGVHRGGRHRGGVHR